MYASFLRTSGAPVNGISKTQLASACLREAPPCGAKAGAFLSSLKNNQQLLTFGRIFSGGYRFSRLRVGLLWNWEQEVFQGM